MKYFIQILLEILVASFLFFNVFVSNNMNNFAVLIVLTIFLVLMWWLHKYKRPVFRGKNEVIISVTCLTLILMIAFYLAGFGTGFSSNYSVIYQNFISASVWLSVFAIVIVTELIRYIVSQAKFKNDKYKIFATFLMVIVYILIDMSLMSKIYNLTNFNQLYEFIAIVLIPSASKNILLCYITEKYGYQPCLVYRLIMDLYIYFIPVTPKLNLFIEAVILLVFPYFVYRILASFSLKTELLPARKDKKKGDTLSTIIFTIIFGILVMLVSREFTYSMIAIGSGSMTGTINKGDAIVYKVYDSEKDELEVDDIIVFYRDNRMIVHRIISKIKIGNTYAYQTKGDANESADNWIVKEEDIIGEVQFRVMYIAWPSVLLNEIF